MRFTLLGTGAAGGIPRWGCGCSACTDARLHPRRKRRPASAEIIHKGRTFLLDAGIMDIDERYADGVDAFLLTHYHVDHVQGLFHLRWGPHAPVPVYAPDDSAGCADLHTHPGCLAFQTVAPFTTIELGLGLSATALPLAHSKPTLGWLINDGERRIAYCTDTRGFPPVTVAALHENTLDVLILDTTHPANHPTPKGHNDLTLSLELIAAVKARRGILTHIGHNCQIALDDGAEVPSHVTVGYDGLEI
jgi:phosphoribosyl 1,2-cyclic phosphate phosphodiesterase